MSESKSFLPIDSDKACLLKWSQTSLYLWNQASSTCHRNKNVKITDNFDFHNLEPVIKDRIKMLNGEWPNYNRGCEHCKLQEQHGGMSDRLQWLQNPENERYVPKELYDDPTALKVRPTQVSVHFSNKCNMKCIYCGPNLSSAWVNEISQFEPDNTRFHDWKKSNDENYEKNVGLFWQWMEENYSSLKAFDILGGEPWIQQETWDCVQWMIERPNLDLDFEIYTNMQIKHELFKRNCEQLKELAKTVREVLITVSIDCWGPESEYIRYGHNMETFKQNMDYLVYQCPELVTTMNWTVSSLSIPYTAPLIKMITEYNRTLNRPRKIAVNYNKCIDPDIYDPSIMPPGTFTNYIEEILELNEEMYGENPYKKYPQGIFNEIDNSPGQPEKVQQLKEKLTLLDSRRGTNWKETFPWLVNIE